MEMSQQLQQEIDDEARVCKNLATLADNEGVVTLTTADIDEFLAGSTGEDANQKSVLRRLKQAHRVIHEALYAPPRK